MNGIVEASKGLSETLSVYATSSGSTWPYVTMPNFEVDVHQRRRASSMEAMFFCPLVRPDQLEDWGAYSMREAAGWLAEGYGADGNPETVAPNPRMISPFSYNNDNTARPPTFSKDDGSFWGLNMSAPVWQTSPPPVRESLVNYNFFTPWFVGGYFAMLSTRSSVTQIVGPNPWINNLISEELHDEFHAKYLSEQQEPGFASSHPHTSLLEPIFRERNNPASEIVGFVCSLLPWDRYIQNLLPTSITGITVVLRNTCGQSFTYAVDGPQASYVGVGDLHETAYDEFETVISFQGSLHGGRNQSATNSECFYSFSVYPTEVLEKEYNSKTPTTMAVAVACAFLLMSLTFVGYEVFVSKKNKKMVSQAARTNKIVSSIFPSNVRDRILQESVPKKEKALKTFLSSDSPDSASAANSGKPIADLFAATTIMFADIVGFTAWSSAREPTQVFVLLETLYQAFDEIARRRAVFKVETIGDCYVAVAGLPEPRHDHAVVMARFANDCLRKMFQLTRELEVVLGPDTGDLSMRFGLHSGPVTAGVLRGDRGRFQLFGDTMNTASRMETTCTRGKIQVSTDTALLLKDAGKESWLLKREDAVMAKGKGLMETFWLNVKSTATSVAGSSEPGSTTTSYVSESDLKSESKRNRLIDWHVQLMKGILQQLTAYGRDRKDQCYEPPVESSSNLLVEVSDVADFPTVESSTPDSNPELSPKIEKMLRSLVTGIASMYHENSFHSFEHASHVTMSVTKLLGRIIDASPTSVYAHPLTQFACVFSALIHDVDHQGLSNSQLKGTMLSEKFQNRSVTEQNSVDVAWNLWSQPEFADLRALVYPSEQEYKFFRQLVVNSVMATDIMDSDWKQQRDERWERAMAGTDANLKASVVLEHLIQASDVSHTMQHWYIYIKWNRCLFNEMRKAHEEGHGSNNDPADSWYENEIGFFDHYVLPLAHKLKECGVFGVSSDEYLNYAKQNRAEWKSKGEQVVKEMREQYLG